jgi:hypothetical protein
MHIPIIVEKALARSQVEMTMKSPESGPQAKGITAYCLKSSKSNELSLFGKETYTCDRIGGEKIELVRVEKFSFRVDKQLLELVS